MALYKKPLDVRIENIPSWVIPLLLIAIIFLLAALFWQNVSGNVLSAQLSKNPVSLSLNESVILRVHVYNPFNALAQNIEINARAAGEENLSVTPQKQTVATLAPNESRTLEFLVLPIDQASEPFLPGNYVITITTFLNGKLFQNNATLTVVK